MRIINLLVFTIYQTILAPIPLYKLNNSYTMLSEQAKRFSIIHGAAMLRSGQLEQLFVTTPTPHHSTSDLLNLIFYRYEGYFGASTAPDNPVRYFSVTDIAQFITSVETAQPIQDSFITKLRDTIMQLAPDVHKRNIVKNLNKLFRTAHACIQDNGPFNAIILGYLFYKIKEKHDILDYMLEINKQISLFENPDFAQSQELQQYWLADNTPGDYETTVLAPLINTLYCAEQPPRTEQTYYAPANNIPQPDCVEASMRGFFNFLLYNPHTHIFDLSRLPAHLQPSPGFCNFYSGARLRPESVNDICTPDGQGQQWMNLLSHHTCGEYKQSFYELYPRKNSILRVINKIVGTTAQNLSEFCTQLSSPIISLHVKNHVTIPTEWSDNTDIFTIDFNDTHFDNPRNYTLTLNLAPDYHSWLEID